MDKFSQLFAIYTDNQYDYLRVQKVEVVESAHTANVFFWVREDVYDNGLDKSLVKDLQSFFKKLFRNYTFRFNFDKLLVSQDLVRLYLAEHLPAAYPFVAANIVMDSIEISVGQRIDIALYLPPLIMQYAQDGHLATELAKETGDHFLMPCHVVLQPTDTVITEQEAKANRTVLPTSIPVEDVAYCCGTRVEIGKSPTMIKCLTSAADYVVACGDVRDYALREFEKPREGEDARRFRRYHYSFVLDDGTGHVKVLFNSKERCIRLETGKDGSLLVRGRAFVNERSGEVNIYAKTIYLCRYDRNYVQQLLRPLPVPESYKRQPSPVPCKENWVQLSLEGFEQQRVKQLVGTYVFVWIKSAVKDKLSPYELSCIRTEEGRPVDQFTTFVFNKELINVEVENKAKVTAAPRMGDLIPDLVKFFYKSTVVAKDIDALQEWLKPMAAAMRYAFECDFADADLLLGKGKKAMTWAQALKAHNVVCEGDSAFDKAYALYQLYLDCKGY